jgi:hypothetical protein
MFDQEKGMIVAFFLDLPENYKFACCPSRSKPKYYKVSTNVYAFLLAF